MAVKLIESMIIFEDHSADNYGAWFPGIVKLPTGRLLVTFSMGNDFEGEHRMGYSVSDDNGNSWHYAGYMFRGIISAGMKPTLLKDGSLIAVGYKFDLVDGELVNRATGGLAPGGNYTAFSNDNGKSWSMPQKIATGLPEVLETSGPCLQLANGDLLSACTPFPRWDGSMPSCRKGYILRSCDNGRTWHKDSIFFQTEKGNIAPYETRLVQQPDGRIVIMIWCLDEAAGKSWNNHAVYSDDNGKTWSSPLDTRMPAQASNIYPLSDNTLLAVHCVREGDCGVFLNRAGIVDGKWETLESTKIWNGASADTIGSLSDMGDNLKFGQPSLIHVKEDNFLIIHWAMSGKKGKILGHRVKFTC